MAKLEKVDARLFMAWLAFEENPDKNPDDAINISLSFEGDLNSIEALGFETNMVFGDEALGVVRFKDIEALVAHEGVLWMAAGKKSRPRLDTAVKDIKARADSLDSGGVLPVGGLWHADETSGVLKSVPKATGKDVLIAVIDTGIDYKHPTFMSDMGPPEKKTRIFRIWDQGLTPASGEKGPAVALLASSNTYGVEYKQDRINKALNDPTAPISHKDCDGHGTHVAGIAAGGTEFQEPGGNAKFVGVAPEASIIAVKHIDTPDEIFYRLSTGARGGPVGVPEQFRDAVIYCLRTAKAENKAVVINMSLGSSQYPGDGLDDDARWMDDLMNPSPTKPGENYPKGAIIVKAAGNEGDPKECQSARIVVPPSGEVTVPLKLIDTRGTTNTRWERCEERTFCPDIGVYFWYRRARPFTDAVKFALRLPHRPFSGDMGVGGWLFHGFVPRVGPPPSLELFAPVTYVHKAVVTHEAPKAVPDPRGGTVRRHLVTFQVQAKQTGPKKTRTISYYPETYEMRIKAPAGTEIFAMCDRYNWSAGGVVAFEIAEELANGTKVDLITDIQVNKFSATDTGGKHVITVAAYDDVGVKGALPGEIVSFSSRGPLRDFSEAKLGPIEEKPEIAAPGRDIMSAEGGDSEPPLSPVQPAYAAHSGTSMAAPMVAGVIALMLEKKRELNTDDVRAALKETVQPVVKPDTGDEAKNAYGSGRINALGSHNHDLLK